MCYNLNRRMMSMTGCWNQSRVKMWVIVLLLCVHQQTWQKAVNSMFLISWEPLSVRQRHVSELAAVRHLSHSLRTTKWVGCLHMIKGRTQDLVQINIPDCWAVLHFPRTPKHTTGGQLNMALPRFTTAGVIFLLFSTSSAVSVESYVDLFSCYLKKLAMSKKDLKWLFFWCAANQRR